MTRRYKDRKDLCRLLVGNFRIKKNAQLSMTLECYRKIPSSWSEQKKKDTAGTWCSAGGDADNIAGGVMDALFPDDSNIVELKVTRKWSKRKDGQGYMKLVVKELT